MPVKKSTADAWNALSADQRDEALKQMTPDEEQRLATELGWGGHATGLSAQPGILTVKGLKDRAMEFIRRGSSYLPAAGGTVGGIVGGSVGTPADIVSGRWAPLLVLWEDLQLEECWRSRAARCSSCNRIR